MARVKHHHFKAMHQYQVLEIQLWIVQDQLSEEELKGLLWLSEEASKTSELMMRSLSQADTKE